MPRDTALRSFHEAVSSGRFAPYDSGRVAVISDEEYGKRQQLPTAA
ncbi:MAG: hypothetical protein ACRDTM_01135 [Micromonosporaceae bacterium]